MQEMLALLRSWPDQDENTKVYTIGPSVMGAVAAKKLGLDALAASHKARVQRMLKAEPILVGGWPAMYEADQKVYRSIRLPAPKDNS